MTDAPAVSFKDENRSLQELTRELRLLRLYNQRFRPDDPQSTMLFLAEAALTCLTLEHFVRVVVGDLAPPVAALYNLLQLAVSKQLLRLPFADQEDGIRKIVAVRNSLLHANYAQAAKGAGCSSVTEYFQTQFASEVEVTFNITDYIMKQVDPMTGKPRTR